MEAIESFDVEGYTVKIYSDDHPESPREWDNLGHMVCWHRGYDLGDRRVRPGEFASLEELAASFDAHVILPLYLLDHSGITISTSSEHFRMVDSAGWDWGQVGCIYVTAEEIRKEYSVDEVTPELEARVREVLVGEVQTYDQYLTGQVYGYVVEDCYGQHWDSCWGFYGLEYAIAEAKQAAEHCGNKE